MVKVNEINGLSDNEVIENAFEDRDLDGVVIPLCKRKIEPERDW